MTTPMLSRFIPRTLIAAAVLFAVAAPAGATVAYRWKTDDGTYAFTDDARRIPEKYRDQARASTMRPLRAYKNFTPAQRSGTQAYRKQLEQSARDLRKLNARLYGEGGTPTTTVYGPPSNDGAALWVGQAGQSTVALQEGLDTASDEPIVIEQKRFYLPGLMNSTRTNTIVRQGDRILAVTKPFAHQSDISDIPSESTLP
jgi:hypothetical protein